MKGNRSSSGLRSFTGAFLEKQLCNRLADDAVGSIEANDRKMTDFFEQFREHITKQFTDVHDRISHHRDEAASHVMEIVFIGDV